MILVSLIIPKFAPGPAASTGELRNRATSGRTSGAEAGFTLIELLAVMSIMAMLFVAVASIYRAPSPRLEVKTAATLIAARMRDLRASAMTVGDERLAIIDVDGRAVRFSDGRTPLQLSRKVALSVTGAESEASSATQAGVRFFPNGSSSGATIQIQAEGQRYEVRINWLTGRVSLAALD
jgi:general secretion pathway protein H